MRKPAARSPGRNGRLPPDWSPSVECEREARRWGYAADDLVPGFRDYYLANGEAKADWDAQFRTWIRRQAQHDGKRQPQQGHMALPIQGGNTADTPLFRLNARYYRPPITGPKPPTEEIFKRESEHGRADAANAWIGKMNRWIDHGKTGDRPPEFLDYLADPDAYDGEVRDTG